ncbi:restriction endonuclease [Ammoniphilus resinae]|uniref:Restriction system protein n=1 Tax=Ammoniphilus resinae TaxID=861532 RepID=A0ABS4GXW3_9BACL|nr:restriction endonuclease [Ammoniphilus resinae]MBP1935109.1 restriction system protein [Ammoniphilus resinae]
MEFVIGSLIITSVLVIGIYLLVVKFRQKRQFSNQGLGEYDLKDITINHIDEMQDGSEFEMYLYRLFLALGYSDAYKTVDSHDFGADLVFTDRSGVRSIVQAKRYSEEYQVGIDAVQQVYTARNYFQAKKAIVVCTTKYTDSCETLAGVNGVLLLNRGDLIKIINAFSQDDYEKAKEMIEREPRIIYEIWDNPNAQRKKDKEAEEVVSLLK